MSTKRWPRVGCAGWAAAASVEAIEDEAEREQRVAELVSQAEANARAINAATLFELDDVVDPAGTRGLIASTLRAAAGAPPEARRRFVDAW